MDESERGVLFFGQQLEVEKGIIRMTDDIFSFFSMESGAKPSFKPLEFLGGGVGPTYLDPVFCWGECGMIHEGP